MESNALKTPLVSIIIPVFNGVSNELESCLQSIKQQTYGNREIIIIDDKSSDNSIELVKHVLSNENFILIAHSQNKGLSQSWNDGIKESHGEYVLLLQQDCQLLNEHALSKGVEKLRDKKNVLLTGFQKVDYKQLNTYQKLLRFRLNEIEESPFAERDISITENKCDLCPIEILRSIGPFSNKLNQSGQDLIFSAKAKALKISIQMDKSLIYSIRYNGENTFSKMIKKEYKYAKGNIAIFRIFRKIEFPISNGKRKSLGKSKIRSRMLNVMLPLPVFLLIIIFLVTFSLPFVILVPIYVFIWITYYVLTIRKNNKINAGLNLPLVKSAVILIVLDLVYLFGTTIGVFKI